MSESNGDFMRRSVELWRAGDLDGWLSTIDPNVGWDISAHPLPDVSNRGRGRDALVNDMFVTYMSGWTDYSMELTEVVDVGDDVILVLHETAKMRDTGVPLDRDLIHVWTVRNKLGVFLRVFKTKADALEALGA